MTTNRKQTYIFFWPGRPKTINSNHCAQPINTITCISNCYHYHRHQVMSVSFIFMPSWPWVNTNTTNVTVQYTSTLHYRQYSLHYTRPRLGLQHVHYTTVYTVTTLQLHYVYTTAYSTVAGLSTKVGYRHSTLHCSLHCILQYTVQPTATGPILLVYY